MSQRLSVEGRDIGYTGPSYVPLIMSNPSTTIVSEGVLAARTLNRRKRLHSKFVDLLSAKLQIFGARTSLPPPVHRPQQDGGASNMAGSRNSSGPWHAAEQYEFLPGSDPQEDTPTAMLVGDTSHPDTTPGDRSSSDSSTSYTTPIPPRAPSSSSYPTHQFTSSTSDIDGEPASPLLGNSATYTSIREESRRWWNFHPHSRRRRKQEGRIWRTFKKGVRRIVRHPLFPQQPITIVRSFHLHLA